MLSDRHLILKRGFWFFCLVSVIYGGIIFITGTACWFQGVLGIPCPGCGLTRAIGALGAGDWRAALQWHPLVFVTVTVFPALAVAWVFKRQFFFSVWGKRFLWSLLCLYLVVYAYRMITMFPLIAPMTPLPTAIWRLIWHGLAWF